MNNNSILGEEEIVLAPTTELLDEAKEISLNTIHDEKFPFVLHYNPNQKNFLLSLLGAVCAIVEENNEECHTISTWMNMTQLAFIKHSNCIECVKTDEGSNPFIAEDAVNLSADSPTGNVVQETIVASPEAQNELATTLSINATSEAITLDGSASSVAASVLSSCDSHPANTDMDRAQVIFENSTAEGCICCPGFEQWFKFTAPASKKYTICTVGDLDTVGTLCDCYGNPIVEVDDYEPCGKINFRIIRNLTSGNTYYIKVGTKNNEVGSYTLRVTDSVLANSVNINKSSITLEKGVRYELPITPNYTYKGYMGARPISELSISIDPSNATEQKIWWWEQNRDILECYTDWDDDGDRYFHIITKKLGTTKLYAMDWKEHGKRDECTVSITEGWPEYPKPNILSRASWGARNVVSDRLVERTNSPQMIIFHHTADKFKSTDTAKIIVEIKETQDEHIDNEGKCDIAYHFIIDPAGGIWQGAEIDEYQRGHAEGHFNDIGVVLLGDFESRWQNVWSPNTLNDDQKEAMKVLSKWLCYKYDLPFDRINRIPPITTHKSASGGTECPGDNAEPWIENDLKNYINNWHP